MENQFSRIIQGCMTWGVWGKNFNTKEMVNHIEENVNLGITSFDHADIYGDYTTEEAFGHAFKKSSIARDKIQLISKCGIQLINESRKSYVKHYNYSKDYIIQQAEQSLKNLRTDYMDLFLLHRPSPLMQVDEITEAIEILKRSGKIKAFGVSNFTPMQIEFLSKELDVDANQIQCSLTHYEALEDDTQFYHQQKGIITMAWSPLGDYYKIDQLSEFRQQLNGLAGKYSCSESQIVLAWLLKHPSNIYPVLGTTKTERMKDAIGALNLNIDLQDWFSLYEISRKKEVS
jgi:predicted oxidoreductase